MLTEKRRTRSTGRGRGGTILRGRMGPGWTPKLSRTDALRLKEGRLEPIASRFVCVKSDPAYVARRYDRNRRQSPDYPENLK